MFIPSTFKRPVSSWNALNLRKPLLMASTVRLRPLRVHTAGCSVEGGGGRGASREGGERPVTPAGVVALAGRGRAGGAGEPVAGLGRAARRSGADAGRGAGDEHDGTVGHGRGL